MQRTKTLRQIIDELEQKHLAEIDMMYDKERNKCDTLLVTNGGVTRVMKKLTQFVERLLEGGSSTALVVWRTHLQLQAKRVLADSGQRKAEDLTRTRVDVR